ncbi:MAG: AAA family ATPase [Dehalococcoidia bacterium]|nr:AAA family ATPase [Dehalococcoidia bacterium]
MQTKGIKIAVTGKGGSGKTMLTALMTKLLAERKDLKILAIDADSAINLPYALGTNFTKTVAELRRYIIEDPSAKDEMQDKPIKAVMEQSLQTGKGFQLLVMGRPEGPGCFCGVNELLKHGIETLSKDFDVTLIDCEAGPEQVNRRVVKGVDFLIIVTDTSIRGAQVAGAITEVMERDKDIRPAHAGLVINRFKEDDKLIREIADRRGIEILAHIPEDPNITEYDGAGKPIIDLPNSSPSVLAVQELLRKMKL